MRYVLPFVCPTLMIAIVVMAATTKVDEKPLTKAVVVNGGEHLLPASSLSKAARPVAEAMEAQLADVGVKGFSVSGDTLYCSINSVPMGDTILLEVEAKSDCPNNSIYGVKRPESLARSEVTDGIEGFLVRWTQLRHEGGEDAPAKEVSHEMGEVERWEVVLDME